MRAVLCALWLVGALVPALGEEIRHVVAAGESASSIARDHYGTVELGQALLDYNRKPDSRLVVGEELRLPSTVRHRVDVGDSWSDLAKRYLGRADAYPALAMLNGAPPEAPLQLGREVIVPVALPYRLKPGDTLATLAERAYGDVGLRNALQEFNQIVDPRRLAVGQELLIPSMTMERRSAPPVPAPVPPRFVAELDEAEAVFFEGEYEQARELLEGMEEPVRESGVAADRQRLGRLLGFVYVAYDLPARACEVLDRFEVDSLELDPDRVSPKVREMLSTCRDADGLAPAQPAP